MRPVRVFKYDYRIIRGDVCLIEDEGLFLRGGAFVLTPLEKIIIDGAILVDLLLQQGNGLQE